MPKVNPTGSQREYLATLGGTNDDAGFDIAVDGSGSAYVVGSTDSNDFTTANALQPISGDGQGAFVATWSPTGSVPIYSTYLGGSGNDSGFGVAVDSAGNAYVTCSTESPDFGNLGGRDAFAAKLSDAGDQRLYLSIFGGSADDAGFGIAIDSSANAYITGSTNSSNFTTANAMQPSSGGAQDVFVTKLDPAGVSLTYSTFLGSGNNGSGFSIAVDATESRMWQALLTPAPFLRRSPFVG